MPISRRADNTTPEALEWFRSYFNCHACRPAEGEDKRYCPTHDEWRAKLEEEGKILPRKVQG